MVGVDNGADEVLWHLGVVRQQLFGILGQAIAAIAKRRIVVVIADARIVSNALA